MVDLVLKNQDVPSNGLHLPHLMSASRVETSPLARASGLDLSLIETGLDLLTQAVRVRAEVAAPT
jgi:hypothetical protein